MSAQNYASASAHHQRAAHYHQEASRHYRSGKDFAHAAHQALLAHGHALRAMDFGHEAAKPHGKHTIECSRAGMPVATPLVAPLLDAPAILQKGLDGADHHMAAAEHHAAAAIHQGKAAVLFREKHYEEAAKEAQLAYRHAHHTVFHDDAGARHYVEHYGKAGPIAELA